MIAIDHHMRLAATVNGVQFGVQLTLAYATALAMAVIGIVTLPEAGHINPTLRLRTELLEVGHRVTYIVQPGEEASYISRNLPFDVLESPSEGAPLGFRPDVVLVEAVLVGLAVMAHAFGIPTMKLSATFPQRFDASLPPLTCDLIPDPSESGRTKVALAWQAEHERHQADAWYSNCADWAQRHGFPGEWIDDRAAMAATFNFPELTLAPEGLDFDRDQTDLFYAGPCVDLSRDETARASIDGYRLEQPIAYCAFGTQTHRYDKVADCITLLIEAARLLPRVKFVVSWEGDEFPNLPTNVLMLKNAPQLALLRRAAVMVTHGGLNSVKEALCLGVPLIVLPFDQDQPGNAARVAFHGYGRKVSWSTTCGAALAQHVSEVLGDSLLTRKVQTFARELQEALNRRHAARAFERCSARCLELAIERSHGAAPVVSTPGERPDTIAEESGLR